jgi:hypothetical protein
MLGNEDGRIYYWHPSGTMEYGECPARGTQGHFYLRTSPIVYHRDGSVSFDEKPCPCGRETGKGKS